MARDRLTIIALAVIAIVLSLVVFALGAIFNVLMGAPVLFAEVFVDAVLVSALYKRVKPMHDQWWVVSAAAHTWKPVMFTDGIFRTSLET